MNELSIFKGFNISKLSETYVTNGALSYFHIIEKYIDKIAKDIYKNQTGNKLGLNPRTLQLSMKIQEVIDEYEQHMSECNKNDPNEAKSVINLKDVLVKFDYIKDLILKSDDENLREDGVILFTVTCPMYSEEEQEEFVNMLDENELRYIMQIVYQEKTLLEKLITNSKMYRLAIEKLNKFPDNGEER